MDTDREIDPYRHRDNNTLSDECHHPCQKPSKRLDSLRKIKRVVEKVTGMDDICNVFLTMGNYDIILTACATDETELYRMIKEIRSADGVLWVDFASIVSRRKVLSKVLAQPE